MKERESEWESVWHYIQHRYSFTLEPVWDSFFISSRWRVKRVYISYFNHLSLFHVFWYFFLLAVVVLFFEHIFLLCAFCLLFHSSLNFSSSSNSIFESNVTSLNLSLSLLRHNSISLTYLPAQSTDQSARDEFFMNFTIFVLLLHGKIAALAFGWQQQWMRREKKKRLNHVTWFSSQSRKSRNEHKPSNEKKDQQRSQLFISSAVCVVVKLQ